MVPRAPQGCPTGRADSAWSDRFLVPKCAARRGVWLLCALILPGCATVGPEYRAPKAFEAHSWSAATDSSLRLGPADEAELVSWWSLFNDPELTDLIEQALGGSPDLAVADARLRRSRALLVPVRAGRLPTLEATGSATASEASAQSSGGATDRIEVYRAGFDAGWELDLFGGVRRSVEAAVADVEAAAADLSAVRVSLVAEVASTYADLRTFEARLVLAESNLQTQLETQELVSSRFDAGLVSRLDVEQAGSNLESTRSQIPDLRVGLTSARHRLAVLTGTVPGSLEIDGGTLPVPPSILAVGIPAEALRRRPDVRAAERRVAAETARIGVAVAELYPRFSLGGSIGLEALGLDGLTGSGSSYFSFGPFFSWRIFDRKEIRAGIEAQTAVQEEALRLYEGAVLAALEEVENALVAFAEEQARRASLERAVAAAEQAEALARDLYRSGLRTFQEVLDTQRTLLSLQDQLAESEGAVVTRLIAAYKALGGGWTPMSDPVAPAAGSGGPSS